MGTQKEERSLATPASNALELDAQKLVTTCGQWQTAQRGFQTLTHYRWKQMAVRAARLISNKISADRLIGDIPVPDTVSVDRETFEFLLEELLYEYSAHMQHGQSELREGRIVLLNQAVKLGWPLDWQQPEIQRLPHLWRFQLQYHEFLLAHIADAPPGESASHWQDVWRVLESWLETFRPESTLRRVDAWHAFCISRRIPVWISLLTNPDIDSTLEQKLTRSLFQQASWLHDHLETDLGGNHLLENLTALALAASFLTTAHSKTWFATVQKKLTAEMKHQVLPSGEHFERSPMYHCQVLRNLLLVALVTQKPCPELSQLSLRVSRIMFDFLQQILHPDGEIPLLGDSGFGEAPSVAQISRLAEKNQLVPMARNPGPTVCGDYWVHQHATGGEDLMIFDAGNVGAAHLPAHAHCDLLGFEASIGGQRWFVDSGNFDYEADSMRQYCRSSLAHNVVTVANDNSCNIWSRFRMGNRGKTRDFRFGDNSNTRWATASHTGYRRLGIKEITRVVAIEPDRFWLVGDLAEGTQKRDLIGYLHLSPKLKLEYRDSESEFSLSLGNNRRNIQFFGVEDLTVVDGWYCRGFGFRESNSVIRYRVPSGKTPMGWILTPAESSPDISLSDRQISLEFKNGQGNSFHWQFM